MNRRGATHVDWAVSMGLFIIYIISFLLFFAPGGESFYKQDVLTGIVRGGFEDTVYYDVEKTLLVIKITELTNPGEHDYKATIYFDDSQNSWPFSDDKKEQDFALLKEDEYVDFELDLGVNPNELSFEWDGFYLDDSYSFWLLYSNGTNYADKGDFSTPSGAEISFNDGNFTYTFGITEQIRGINYDKLQGLDVAYVYDDLKDEWNYPKNKEFALEVRGAG